MAASPLAKYQENEILTLSPARRVVFLYTFLLTNLHQARAAIADADIETRSLRLMKAGDVVAELLASLDLERGGDVARQLQRIYGWMISELMEINRRPTLQRLDQVTACVRELHQAWARVAEEPAPAVVG